MEEKDALKNLLDQNPEFGRIITSLKISATLENVENIPQEEEFVVVCGPSHAGITGSQQHRCNCGRIIWIAPSTQKIMKERPGSTKLMCFYCVQSIANNIQDK